MTRPSATPTMSDVLGWAKDGFIAPDAEARKKLQADQEKYDADARAFARLFDTAEGKRVLEVLADATVRRPPVNHQLSGHAYVAYAQLRQGQDQMLALILTYLDHADQLETTHGPERTGDAARSEPQSGPGGFGLWGDGQPPGGPGDDGDDGPGYDDFDPAGNVAVR